MGEVPHGTLPSARHASLTQVGGLLLLPPLEAVGLHTQMNRDSRSSMTNTECYLQSTLDMQVKSTDNSLGTVSQTHTGAKPENRHHRSGKHSPLGHTEARTGRLPPR